MGKVTQKLYKIGYNNIYINLDLFANILYLGGGERTSTNVVTLEGVRVFVSHPNMSGVEVLKDKSTEYVDNFNNPSAYVHKEDVVSIGIYLRGLCAGTHNVYVTARFGTQVRVIFRGVVVVANNPNTEENPDSVFQELIICETYSDDPFDPTALEQEVAGKADGSVYTVDEYSNAVLITEIARYAFYDDGTIQVNINGVVYETTAPSLDAFTKCVVFFKIDNRNYGVVSGMTWYDFIQTSANNLGLLESGGEVVNAGGQYVMDENAGENVRIDDKILRDGNYILN